MTTIDPKRKSKKRSAANSRFRSQLESLTFFLDRSLGSEVVAAELAKAGCSVEVHDKHFAQAAKDADWLAVVGQRGWIVLTKDQHIRTRHSELLAMWKGNVATFVITRSGMDGTQMASAFVRALPRMCRVLRGQPKPFVAGVSPSGAVRVIERGIPRWFRRQLQRRQR